MNGSLQGWDGHGCGIRNPDERGAPNIFGGKIPTRQDELFFFDRPLLVVTTVPGRYGKTIVLPSAGPIRWQSKSACW